MLENADHLCVVLVGTRNPLNLGAAARAMSNLGFLQLRLVSPYNVAVREARSAVGPAGELLAKAEQFKTVADAVGDCTLVVGTTAVRHRELHHPLRRLEYGARLIRKHLAGGRVALLFGTEKTGLSNDALSHCHWLMRIPTREQHISMNLGQAVAVCLYGIGSSHGAGPAPQESAAATAGELEKITQGLYEVLMLSGYVKPGNDAVSEKKVRRLMLRLNLQAMDAKVFLGMVRQIVWKLRQANDR